MEPELEALGRHVAAQQDAAFTTHLDTHAASLRWQSHLASRNVPTHRRIHLGMLGLGTMAVCAAAVGFVLAPAEHEGSAAHPWHAHGYGPQELRPSVVSDAAVPVHLSDGTTLSLSPDAKMQLLEAGLGNPGSRRSPEVRLLEGEVRTIRPGQVDVQWHMEAGGFSLAGNATVFSVRWDPGRRVLDVGVEKGSLDVSGPIVGTHRQVFAGQRLVVTLGEQSVVLSMTETEHVSGPAPGQEATRDVGKRRPAPSPEKPGWPAVPTWRRALSEGEYREALRLVEATGLEAVCLEATLRELMRLGRAVRLAGGTDQLDVVYSTVRERFPDTREAATAAFMLGRSAQSSSAFDEAVSWYERYAKEAPDGPFASESAGRLIEAYLGEGVRASARRAATSYLERFPGGAHADYARQIASSLP